VSAAGLEPATHALKGPLNHMLTTTCTSSLLHTRRNKISEMQKRHSSGCPEGAPRFLTQSCQLPACQSRTILFAIVKWSGLFYDIRDNGPTWMSVPVCTRQYWLIT
jgi:hypothetical protein